MSSWSLLFDGFDPGREDLREALCTLGNGYFATRGAVPELPADDVHYPGTYLAGGYNRLRTDIAGEEVENEDLVNLPNWLLLTFSLDGEAWFDPQQIELLHYRQELDLRSGVLLRDLRFRDRHGRTTRLRQRRLVHMASPHLAALETVLVAEDWDGTVVFRSALDGRVVNDGVRRYRPLRNRHLLCLETTQIDAHSVLLKVTTGQSELRIAQAARTRVFEDGLLRHPPRRLQRESGYIDQQFGLEVRRGREIRVEKVLALHTSRDPAISEAGHQARLALGRADDFAALLDSHSLAWELLWRRFDIELEEANPREEVRVLTILRLHTFHLLQTVSPHTIDLDVGVPSRGWHGEAYRGHIFWDELYIFPLLNLRVPEIARALLKYRYRRLDEARAAARAAEMPGAMYPWQSGSDGREESQKVHLNPVSEHWIADHTHLQRHVNSAVAYNVWQYYQVTGDMEFLAYYGAEMLLEIARFWGGMASFNEKLGRFEIVGVMGPDEYHDAYPDSDRPGLRNNAYTNLMAVWVLRTALEVLQILPSERREELAAKLALEAPEIARWEEASRKMAIFFHDEGIISQFQGYEDLEEFPWEEYRQRFGPVMRLDRILEAEGDTPNRYKLSKQADVLMLFYLFSTEELLELFGRLGYTFTPEMIPRNIEYYLQRTSHGSTLSQVVHSWVLARSDRSGSWKLFTQALLSDLADLQGGTTPEGIHLGAMAGTVDLIQRAYTGIETRGEILRFNPRLPVELRRLRLSVHYRGQSLQVEITHQRFRLHCRLCGLQPVWIQFRDELFTLEGGQTRDFHW